MEKDANNEDVKNEDKKENKTNNENVLVWKIAALGSTALLVLVLFYSPEFRSGLGLNDTKNNVNTTEKARNDLSGLSSVVLPEKGVVLPVKWGDIGKKMVSSGVIDSGKFESIYTRRGGLSPTDKKLIYNSDNGNITINAQNSGVLLNLFWALGLSNKNPVLEKGPMMDKKYGGAGRFASTGGWTIAKGDTMQYYSKLELIKLTPAQQLLVEKVSKNIYRPCCGNPTYFPDCNHGMAMLGLLELLASQGVGEAEMYKTALLVNSYWFPDTYLTIAKYFESQNVSWDKVNPKIALSYAYSSAAGYKNISSKVQSPQSGGGVACGV